MSVETVEGVALGTLPQTTITIQDDDPLITLRQVGDAALESDTQFQVFARLSAPTNETITIPLTYRGTATRNADYQAPSSIVIPAGEVTGTAAITLVDDDLFEGDETIRIYAGTPNAGQLQTSGVLETTIRDNDEPQRLFWTLGNVTTREGVNLVTMQVELTRASSGVITVDIEYRNESAVEGLDYVPTVHSLTFAPGQTQQQFDVIIQDDLESEQNENFRLRLINPTNALLAVNPSYHFATVRVTDNELLSAADVNSLRADIESQINGQFDSQPASAESLDALGRHLAAMAATINNQGDLDNIGLSVAAGGAVGLLAPYLPVAALAVGGLELLLGKFLVDHYEGEDPEVVDRDQLISDYANDRWRFMRRAAQEIAKDATLIFVNSFTSLFSAEGLLSRGLTALADYIGENLYVDIALPHVEIPFLGINTRDISTGPVLDALDTWDDAAVEWWDQQQDAIQAGFDTFGNAVSDAWEGAVSAVSSWFGPSAGRSIFVDINFNGIRDADEMLAETSSDGRTIVTGMESVDTNSDGTFDADEGQWIATGGVDTSVNRPIEMNSRAPASYSFITPTSTLISELLTQGVFARDDAGVALAERRVLQALGAGNLATANFNFVQQAANGDEDAAVLFARETQLYNVIVGLANLFNATNPTLSVTQYADVVVSDIAAKITGDGTSINATVPLVVLNVLQGVSVRTGVTIDPAVAIAVSDAIAYANQYVEQFTPEGTIAYLEQVVRAQQVTQTVVVDAIGELVNSQLLLVNFQAQTTASQLATAAGNATIGNIIPVYLNVSDTFGVEGSGGQDSTFTFTVSPIAQVSNLPLTVDYRVVGANAEDDSDFVATHGQLTWAPGDLSDRTIDITVFADNDFEVDEVFTLVLENPDNTVLLRTSATATIFDDDRLEVSSNNGLADQYVIAVDDGFGVVLQNDQELFAGTVGVSTNLLIGADEADELVLYTGQDTQILLQTTLDGLRQLSMSGLVIDIEGPLAISSEAIPAVEGIQEIISFDSQLNLSATVPADFLDTTATVTWSLIYEGEEVYTSTGESTTITPLAEGLHTLRTIASDGYRIAIVEHEIYVDATSPVAVDDQFSVSEDSILAVQSSNGMLANDYDQIAAPILVSALNGSPVVNSGPFEFASATLDPSIPYLATSINDTNYYGVRFEVTETIQVDRVGGNFQFISGTGPFAAIVQLDGPTDFPDSENLSTPDVLATTVVPVAYQQDGDVRGDIDVTLQPGWYAVMFGTGAFGSTGITNLLLNNVPNGNQTFIHSQPTVPRFLTPTAFSGVPNARFVIEGTTSSDAPITLDSGAIVTVASDGSFTYDPNGQFESLVPGSTATDSFTYTVTDSAGLSAQGTTTITIDGVNDAPVALDDHYSLSEDLLASPVTSVGIYANDTDVDGDRLTLTEVDGQPINFSPPFSFASAAADPTLSASTTSINDTNYYGVRFEISETTRIDRVGANLQSAGGSGPFAALVALDGPSDYPDSLDLTTSDLITTTVIAVEPGHMGDAFADVDVTLQPGWYALVLGSGRFNATGVTNLRLGHPPVGSPSVFQASLGLGEFRPALPEALFQGARFLLEGTAAGTETTINLASGATIIARSNGRLLYDPRTAFNYLTTDQTATDSFTYQVTDEFGATGTATVTFTINGSDDTPIARDDNYEVSENLVAASSVSSGLLVNDSDPEGTPLTLVEVDGRLFNAKLTLDSGATIEPGTLPNSFVYDPRSAFDYLIAGQSASDQFTYTVADATGNQSTATVSFTINGVDDPAVISGQSQISTGEDVDIVAGQLSIIDPDLNQAFFVPQTSVSGSYGTFSIDENGEWSYDLNNVLTNSLDEGDSPVESFTVQSLDGSASRTIDITIIGGADADTDGVDDTIEDTIGDGNADGVPDSEQDNVASLPNAVTSTTVTLATASDSNLVNVIASNPQLLDEQPPADVQLPIGLLQFTVLVAPGAAADVRLYYDASEPVNAIYKYGPIDGGTTGYYLFEDVAFGIDEFGNSFVDLQLVDGGAGDADGQANGQIVDPVGLALVPGMGDDYVTTAEDQPLSFDPTVNDVLQHPITINSVSQPEFGTASSNADGTVSYQPNQDFFGADSFTYSVTDATGFTGTATVFVTVLPVNDAPTIELSSADANKLEGQQASATGTFGDIDPGETLELSASIGDIHDNGDGTWSWYFTPTDGPDESQTVVIQVTDGDESTTTEFQLVVNNVPVTFEAGEDAALVPADEGVFVRTGIAFTDPGSDEWTGTVDYGDDTGEQALTVDSIGKTFDLSHTYTTEGTFTVTVRLKDDDSEFVTDTFAVSVILNQPPVAVDDSLVVHEDAGSVDLTGVLGDAEFGLLGNDSDPDGDDVVIIAIDDSQISRGSIQLVDGRVVFDPNGEFESLAFGESDTQELVYTIADPSGETSSATAVIVVEGANDGPTISVDDATVTVGEGQTAENVGSFGDVDGSDTLILSSSEGVVWDTGDGRWAWSWDTQDGPVDSQLVTITVADDFVSSSVSFQLNVTNVAPTAAIDSISLPRLEGTEITVVGSSQDPAAEADHLQYAFQVWKHVQETQLGDNLIVNGDFEQSPALTWTGQNGQNYEVFAEIPGWTSSSMPGFLVRTSRGYRAIDSLDRAQELIDGRWSYADNTSLQSTINFVDTGDNGRFANDLAFPLNSNWDDNNFAVLATGLVHIPHDGDWTFGTNSDDGVRLSVGGVELILDDRQHAPEDHFGTIHLPTGWHEVQLLYFERRGGATVELFAAEGSFDQWDPSFRLVGDVASGGLQVVTPSSIEIQEGDHGTGVADGNQVAELDLPDGIDNATSRTLRQTVSVTEGGVYRLSLDVAKRNSDDAANGLQVWASGTLLGVIQPSQNRLETYSFQMDLTAGEHVIELIGQSNSNLGSVVDNVRLQQVIELNDWVLFAEQPASEFSEFRFTPDNDGDYRVELTVSDKDGSVTSADEMISVANALPSVLSLTSSHPDLEHRSDDGVVTVSGEFNDPGSLDSHIVTIDWGDGTVSELSSSEITNRQF
ncbi:MAG: tandem-95 repeat protein, partial [Planctomycetales bacterium]|nr:tandem-95 repeat protein [Planctomycetales bacterium]